MIRWLGPGSAGRIKAPDSTSLVTIQIGAKIQGTSQLLNSGIVLALLRAVEEWALPFATLRLLYAAKLTLSIFDPGLVCRHIVHLVRCDVLGNLLPGLAALKEILLFEWGQSQGGGGVLFHNPGIDDILALFDVEGVGPLAVDGVQGVLLALAGLVQACGEGVLLSA